MKEKIDLVKVWIKKADNDLLTAENSIKPRFGKLVKNKKSSLTFWDLLL